MQDEENGIVPAHASQPLYADVIVPRHIARAFTYRVPSSLKQMLQIGHFVLVPFGRVMLEAAVVSISDRPPVGLKTHDLKEIRSLLHGPGDSSPFKLQFQLSRRIADHYVAPWGQCLRLISSVRTPQRTREARYVATEAGRAALKEGICPEAVRPLLERIARRSTGCLSSTLQSSGTQSRRGIEILEKNLWIVLVEPRSQGKVVHKRQQRLPGDIIEPHDLLDEALPVNIRHEADPLVADRITAGLKSQQYSRMVIHAPMEQRISLLARGIHTAQALGKSVIIISGEVAKANWLRRRLSAITTLTIADPSTFKVPLTQNPASVVMVGPRSAVFAPLPGLGLIWVDEEDDAALKELKEPRYHAREVACMKGEIERAVVVLASSHPSLESYTDAIAERYALGVGECPDRPPVELVDLRLVSKTSPLSAELIAAMQRAVDRKLGVLLFLNRKGYAGALVCRECGWVPRCMSCAVAFPYSREIATLVCRYCGATAALPDACPSCQASRLSPVGEGTERLEMEARRVLPGARVLRLDGDTLRRPASARDLWGKVRAGRFDIVIGTQAVFQREPLPQMGLVGIVQADSGLHLPDFRAAERTYQLLVDAVEVVRPVSEGGRVILQTWLPTHHVIAAIASGDYRQFYAEELAARRLLGYPPAHYLVSLSILGKDRGLVDKAAQQWKAQLAQHTQDGAITILGPVPAMTGRARGIHRDHILLKGEDRRRLCGAVRESVARMEDEHRKGRLKFIVDVDPVDMM